MIKLFQLSFIILGGISLSFAKTPLEIVNIAFYKVPPHFTNMNDPNNFEGPLSDYFNKVLGPLMQVKFVFKRNIRIDNIAQASKLDKIDLVIGVVRARPKFYTFSKEPFYKSKPIFLTKEKYRNNLPKEWTLGHYPTAPKKVIPFVRMLAPKIFFLSARDWTFRGVKMLNEDRVQVLLDLDINGSSFALNSINKRMNYACIELPMKPISFYLGFSLKSSKHKKLLKKYNFVQEKNKLSYNDFLMKFIKRKKLSTLKCKHSLNFLK